MIHIRHIVFLVAMMGLCSCAHRQGGPSEVSLGVMESWRSQRSYYALVEIVDAYIDPSIHRATKHQVEELLGSLRDDGHPGASRDCWIYSSSRRIPRGSYLCIYFDDRDIVREIDWISE